MFHPNIKRAHKILLLCLFALVAPSCKLFLFLVRPFEASAIKGQDPTPLSESKREHFVSTKKLLQDVAYLSSPDCDGRKPGTPGNALAREYIKERMREAGLFVSEQSFTFTRTERKAKETSVEGINVIGLLRGADPGAKWIVITAHYDHLGRKNGDFYAGADDNAAGVAALFALAEYFSSKPTTHNLLFVAFDVEEEGSIGAARFMKENTIVAKEDIAFNLNLDMISRSDEQELFAITKASIEQEPLRKLLFELQPKVGFKLMVSVDDRSIRALASDHLVFSLYKIPFLYLGVSDHEDYHKHSDKLAKIEPNFYAAVVDGAVLMLSGIDAMLP